MADTLPPGVTPNTTCGAHVTHGPKFYGMLQPFIDGAVTAEPSAGMRATGAVPFRADGCRSSPFVASAHR